MHRSLLNKVGTACLHMALSASSLSAMGAAQSYYRTRRGAYGPGQTYLADTGVRPLSAFALGKQAEPKLNDNVVSTESNFHFVKGTCVRELVIVDGAVQDKSVFYKQNQPGVDVVEISGDGGILELMDILSGYSNLEAVHLVSHAKSGTLQIGGQEVNQATFEQNVSSYAAINGAIKEGGDLLLYGCELAKGQKGENFLKIIKGNTHVDVAASTDKTGNAAYAADWELEVQKGDINATPLSESIAMNDFTGVLQSFTMDAVDIYNAGAYAGSGNNATFYENGGMSFILTVDGLSDGTRATNDHVYIGGGGVTYEDQVTLSISGASSFDPASIFLYSSIAVTFTITSDVSGSVTSSALSNSGEMVMLGALDANTTQITITSTPPGSFWTGHIDSFVLTSAVPSNAAPVATASGGITPFVEDAGAVVIDNGITVTDSDDATLASATVMITSGFQLGEDVLAFTNGAGMGNIATGPSLANTLSLTSVGATATVAEWQTALRAVTYNNTSDTPDPANRIITFRVNDGTDPSTGSAKTVSVTAVNDAPVVTAPAGAYTVDEQTDLDIHGAAFFGVTDVDETGAGANAMVSVPVSEGIITVVAGNSGISSIMNSGTNAVSFSGTIAQINNILTAAGTGTIVYNANLDDPPASTTITVTVNDEGNTGTDPLLTGDGTSEEGTNNQTINITGVNDEPTFSATRVGATAIFSMGDSPLSLYSSTGIDAIEAGQNISGIILTITNVDDGSDEEITIDGEGVPLATDNNTTTANSFAWDVSFASTTATVAITGDKATGFYQTMVDGLAYENTAASPSTSNTRVMTLSNLTDDGSNAGANDNINDLSGANTDVTLTIAEMPAFTGVTVANSNATIDVTFNKPVFTTTGGSGTLTTADFVYDISASTGDGTVTLVSGATPSTISQSVNTYTLGISYTGVPDGSETVTLSPANGSAIFDANDVEVDADQSPNDEVDLNGVAVVTAAAGVDDTYIIGENIDITVTYDADVTVTGSPQLELALNTGGNVNAVYNSGASSATGLVFRYQVVASNLDTDGIAINSTAIDLNSGNITDDVITSNPTVNLDLNGIVATTNVRVDGVSPQFNVVPANPIANNSYVDVTFTEGLFNMGNGTGGVDASDFDLTQTVAGGASVSLLSALQDDDIDPGVAAALGAGATTVRFFLTIAGDPDGTERFDLRPSGASAIFDQFGNAMSTGEVSSDIDLNDTDPVEFDNAVVNATNTTITLTFSENVGGNAGVNQNLVAADFDIGITASASGGTASAINISGVSHTAPSNTAVLTVSITGTPDGDETIDIGPTAANSIYGVTSGAMQATEEITLDAVDELAPTIASVVATGDGGNGVFGGTEQIMVTVTLANSETGATVTGGFSGLIGIYGSSEAFSDDGGGSYSFTTFQSQFFNHGMINIPVQADDGITTPDTDDVDVTVDTDAPVVTIDEISTNDGEPTLMGDITPADMTASVDIEIPGSDPASIFTATVNGSGDSWTLDLSAVLNSPLSNGTYDVVATVTDGEGNQNTDESSNELEIESTPPAITVNTPGIDLYGQDATVPVQLNELGDIYYLIEADGTGSNAATVRSSGTQLNIDQSGIDFDIDVVLAAVNTAYDLRIVAEDLGGNLTAVTNVDLQAGGIMITPASTLNVCIDGPSSTLASITIAEAINNDFRLGSGQTFTIGLPAGFSFDTDVTPTFTESTADIANFSHSYIGSATLQISLDVIAEASLDNFTIEDLEIFAAGTAQGAAVDITRVGGNADFFNLAVDDGGVLGDLTSSAKPGQPTMNFGGNPAGDTVFEPNGNFTFTATGGSLSYRWYDEDDNVSVNQTASFDQSDLNGIPSSSYDNSAVGVYPLFLSTVDASGCESDTYETGIAILEFTIDPDKTTFAEFEAAAELRYSQVSGYTSSYTGTGLGPIDLTTNPGEATIAFDPFTATTVGSPHTITYQLTNGTNTFTTGLDLTVVSGTGVSSIFSNVPVTFPEDEEYFDFYVGEATSDLNVNIADLPGAGTGGEDFEFVELTGVGISQPPLYDLPTIMPPFDLVDDDATTDGWIFTAPNVGTDPKVFTINRFVVLNNKPETSKFQFGSAEFTVYPLPQITLDENYDGNSYCEEDAFISIDYLLRNFSDVSSVSTNTGFTAEGYTVDRLTGTPASTSVASGGIIDFASLLNDVTVGLQMGREFETYDITFTSEPDDDPSPANGTSSLTFKITVYPTPQAQPLDLTSSSKGVDNFDVDPNSNADYIFRYCESETSFETLVVANVDGDERVTWYDSDRDVLGTSTTNGSKISGSELFQNNPTFPPDPDIYTFAYTVTDFIGASAGFEGCEGDFTIVQIEVYPDVVNPPIDLTASLRGEDKSSGSEENYFVFEYCQGEAVEGLAVVQDNLSEDLNSGVPAGWSTTGGVAAGAVLAQGGVGNAIRLNTNSTSNEIVTSDYQSIQRVSFDYRTTAVGTTGASFVVEASGNEATYQIGSLVANSTTYQTFEADILGSLTDADITIYIDVVGDVNLIVDNFSVASTIPNKTFYQWFDDSNNPITVGATGAVSASATELLGTTTPTADTYTFFVNKIENINTTETPNFDGCVGESTQIDIVVHSIPAAPTGFATDVNVHSGESSINSRLLSTDLVDNPASANIDYIWSATNALGATDTINTVVSGVDNPDVNYGTLLSNLTTSIADPSGYYNVTSTYNASAYLFQVANELNRQVDAFPGCASAMGTEVNFTIYPLAMAPILTDTSAITEFNNDNSTAGDTSDDFGDNVELNFCAGDLEALDSISAVSRYSSSNEQEYTWYRSNGAGDKLQEIAISDADGSFATAAELFLTGITSDLTTYYLVSQTTDIENSVYDGGESDSVRLRVNIYDVPNAPGSASVSDSTEFYYCFGEGIQALTVETTETDLVTYQWYASEADAIAGTNPIHTGATMEASNMNPDESTATNLAGNPAVGTYTFYATQRTDIITTTANGDGFSRPTFTGCESVPIEFTIYVRGIPAAPTLIDADLLLCEGDDAAAFSINNRATGAWVTWYDDMSVVLKEAQENSFDSDDAVDGGGPLNVSIMANNFSVSQTTDSLFNGSDFAGCISALTSISATEYPDPEGPDLQYLSIMPLLEDGDTVGICETNTGALDFTISGPGSVFNWYQADDEGDVTNTTPVFGSSGDADGADLKLLTAQDGLRYFKVSQTEYVTASFDGCETEEAERTFVKVAIFDTPTVPTVDAGQINFLTDGSGFVTDYYFTYDSAQNYNSQLASGLFDFAGVNVVGTDLMITTIDESSILTNEAGQTFNFTYITTTPNSNDGTVSLANLGLLGTGSNALPGDPVSASPDGSDNPTNVEVYSFTVSQSQFDGQHMNPSACNGPEATVNINILPVPATPSPVDASIYICDNDVSPTADAPVNVNTSLELSITNQASGAIIEWFEGLPLPDRSNLLQESSSATFRPDAFGVGGTSTVFDDDIDQTIDIYARQITNTQIIVDGGTYSGSVSKDTLIRIIKYAEPLTPSVGYLTNLEVSDPNTPLVVGICEGSTGDPSLFNFMLSSSESSARFVWYASNASETVGAVVHTTGIWNSGDSPIEVDGIDLNLELTNESVQYFKVAQITDAIGDFDGCTTTDDDMLLVQINIFGTPVAPNFLAADNNAVSAIGNPFEFYLVYDSADDATFYNDQLKDFVFTPTGAPKIGLDPELSNTADIEYNWYFRDSSPETVLLDANQADFDNLGMTSFLPRDGADPANVEADRNNPTTIESYSFEVRQAQFGSQNANSEACESPSQFVDVNIVPIPDTPTPAQDLVEICEDESVSTLSITNRAPGAQVHWFSVDPRGMTVEPDTLNFVNGVLDGQSYTPIEVEGMEGTYTYYVRQVNNIEIGGTNFQGAVSEVAEVMITVFPNAGVPESTAENNQYIYCLGDPIENLQVLEPENGVTYAWYGDINLNSFLGNTTSNSNFLIPSLNGAFDENTVGTYNYYVTSTLSGQGCESSATLVQIIINGLPDPEIKFSTGLTFENEEDVPEFYQICVDEGTVAIVGSRSGNAAGTFSGNGIVQNGINATFDPLLALGINNPLELPEFATDTIYVSYSLENTSNCDADQRVGFVVTALPRPNFTAEISSPSLVDVLRAADDAGVACVDIDPNNLATVTRMTLKALGGKQTGQFILRKGSIIDTLAIANGEIEFELDEWSDPSKTQDTLFVRYVFADVFGCSYFKDKTILLHENPIVEFDHIVGCVGEPVTFIARALAPFSDSDIESWDWNITPQSVPNADIPLINGDGNQNVTASFIDASTYVMSVRGESANYMPIDDLTSCLSIDEATINASTASLDEERDEIGNTQLIPIGDFPDVDFSWRDITENEPTIVSGKKTNLQNLGQNVDLKDLNGIKQVWMDWGDESPLDTLLANELSIGVAFGDESHTYFSDGWYNAKLKISTINGCIDSTTKVIKVLPHIIVDPAVGLINDFSANTQEEAGWFVDETEMGSVIGKSTSWTYGPIADIVQNGFNSSQGWGTDKDATGYQGDAGSWVFSPSYDISAFEKPMVVFDGHYDFAQNDGAIMEYSIDNGMSWSMLGQFINGDEEGSGIYWYGTPNIRADPGGQRDENPNANAPGWGFPRAMEIVNEETEEAEGFVSSMRHKLDEIPIDDRQNVRFRFNFAASSANSAPGFVFDNFEIVERGRISLIEQFSNSNADQSRGGFAGGQYTSFLLNNNVNTRLDSALLNNNDLIAVNYYTELYGNDPLFEVSQDGPSARTLFYGLNAVTSILDGNVSGGTNLSTNADTPPWTGAESNRNTLRDAEFDLQLRLNTSDNDELSVTYDITSGDDFSGEDIRVYLAVVEKVLTGETLPNGEPNPRNVFREFLPNALGHVLTDLSEGGVNTMTETWNIDAKKVLDPDQLAVVAFVQKANGDREVYQAARVDINGKTSVLGVGDLIEVDDLNLYPNPANDAFFITFDRTLEEDFQWRLFDQSGRLMKNGEVFKGMDGFRVDSAILPSGLYLMSIGNETKQYTHLKVIVKH